METKIINEQLEDKQQIVTYKYLSQKLAIHPNKAKQLLKDYACKLTDDKNYSVSIIIGGILKETDEFCIVLANDDHAKTVRRRFKKINFEHLYSIQPISRLSDINNALYLVDSSENNFVNLPSSIKKTEKGIMSIPVKSVETAMEIDVPLGKETNSTSNTVSNYSKQIVSKQSVKTELDKTQKNNNKLESFVEKNENNKTKPEEIEKKVIPKKINSDFFTKFKKSNNLDNTKADIKEKVSTENVIIDQIKDEDVEVSKPKKNNPQENLNSKNEVKTKKKSLKKKNDEKKSNTKVKRKRIQTFDSSDEEIDSEEEDKKRSETIMDVEEEVDFVQPTPPRPTIRENKKKEKQMTTSTFIDDDGFVCTTKEVKLVEIECEPSESVGNVENLVANELDTEPINKKPKPCESDINIQKEKNKVKNKPSKNNKSTQGMKQSSLTSFFKTK
ncbi:DNA polymerase subunit Cdc27 [Cinara cedri]|uniref:DNA polymerase delta subunit 3 n=1 Tax=Cinara cedri TaxID=506608 RepID=A0A5E4MEL7_9HEMI|nr:DNA polymerase subunit Cdc27 [Cinara cedri]